MTSQPTEQKVGIGVKTNETVENIYRLFIQLRLLLTNPENINETISPISVLNELTEICNRKYHNATDIFEIILKNYLLLIDSNEFIDIIPHRYLSANNNFISNFYHSLNVYDTSDMFSSMESTVRMKMYYRLLDQISSSKRIISFLNNDENIHELIANSYRIILLIIFRVLCYIQDLNVNLSMIKLKKYESILFIPLITFIGKYFSKNKPSENDILIKPILNFLRTISKETSTIPIFINIKCPEICLRWLSLSYLKNEEYEYIMNILNNISCHDEGTIILNKYKCIEVFKKFKKEILFTKIDYIINNSMYKNLLFIINMINFSTQNSSDVKGTHDYEIIRNSLLPAIKIGLSSPTFMYLGYDTSELLIILMKLFTNDNIVNYILQEYTISEFFSDALKRLYKSVETMVIDKKILLIIILGNIFWSISFQEQYKNDLIKNIQLITKLERFSINYLSSYTLPSRQIFSLKRAIDGIKQNLYPLKSITISTTRSLMISYSYLDFEFYRKLYEILSKNSKFSICIDADNWKQIAQNIEQSNLVLFLLSKDFFTNKSCRQELIYTIDTLKKPCIPIFIDRNYTPIDWLYQRIDKLKTIYFGEDTCDELLSMINEILSMEINSSDIKQWNDKEVKQWFINHNLISELYEFYQFQNGNELLLYAQAISTYSWTKEYERIKSRFEKKFQQEEKQLSPHEFLKFINALERVRHLI